MSDPRGTLITITASIIMTKEHVTLSVNKMSGEPLNE